MGRVLVQAEVKAVYREVNRDKVEPSDLAAQVKAKIEQAFEGQGAEVEVRVSAKDA